MRRAVLILVLATALSAGAVTTIPWEEAGKHVGEEVVVKGRVLGVHCSPLSCLLAFEPTFNGFTAVVQAEHFDLFPPEKLDDLFSGRQVEVHGTVRLSDRKPEIAVDSRDDLKLSVAERRKDRDEARAQAEVTERLGAVLDQVTQLTERMAATQQRMEALLAQLEQRMADLAAQAQAQAPPPPAQPSYGEPQPRPAYEALRTIKRGMSRNDVSRLIGQPEYVEYGAGGWMTWYYGFGRSVSFDGRGRVQGMVGFPAP